MCLFGGVYTSPNFFLIQIKSIKMLYVVTDTELNDTLFEVLSSEKLYLPIMKEIATIQYLTGCRINDLLQFNRWSVLIDGNIQLQPQKGNLLRIFTPAEITPTFYDAIIANKNIFTGINYRKYEYHLELELHKYNFTLGNKGVSSHLFRHNYARGWKAAGETDAQIKTRLGENQQSSANHYIYSVIYWGKAPE